MRSVGARGVVHMPQFNGKQEGESTKANLTCAAPATVSRRETRRRSGHSAFIKQPLDESARIPANKVVERLKTGASP